MIKTVDNKAVTHAERLCQPAVAATQMHDQATFDAGCVENLPGFFIVLICLRLYDE